jgi:dTDP-4-dehydrorhamnose 3,5-epimerase
VLSLDDFVQDSSTSALIQRPAEQDSPAGDLIDGVTLTPLSRGADGRGSLHELLTLREDVPEPIVHVYQVSAEPKSIRAWVYHKHQSDRLAFTNGEFRVVLYDLRPDSPTFGKLNVFDLGAARRCRLRIPPLVVHGVQNRGDTVANFVNLPTRPYYPDDPDKWRVPYDHPGVPYRF